MSEMTKERLFKYLSLRMENESRMEKLTRLRNNAELPAAKEGDGSKHTGSNKGKLENAVIRYAQEKDTYMPIIESNREEMRIIRESINALDNPMEREVLRLRYIDGKGYRHMPWSDIATRIYGDDDESNLLAIYRLHGRALQNIAANKKFDSK